jgi:hypothetical protein
VASPPGIVQACYLLIFFCMNKVRNSLIAGAALAALGISALGVGTTFAAEKRAEGNGPFQGLVEAIATKFNLSTTEVQAVFDEQRDAMMADRQAKEAARLSERLSVAVTNGKITQEQADKIAAKVAELQAERKNAVMDDSLTPEEREAAMKAEKEALKAWATENDVPLQYLHEGFMGGPGGRGEHGKGGPRELFGEKPAKDSGSLEKVK